MNTHEAIKILRNTAWLGTNEDREKTEQAIEVVAEALEQEPTTEQSSLVDIVQCKDCMLNTINTDGATEPWCYKFGYAVEDTDFCSYGERRE